MPSRPHPHPYNMADGIFPDFVRPAAEEENQKRIEPL